MYRKVLFPCEPGGFPLVVNRQTPQTDMELHTHAFTELVVILSGRGVHFSDDESYEIMAGDAFVVSGPHGYRDTKDLHLVNVLFHADRLGLPMAEARKLPGYHAFFALEPRYRKRHRFRSCLRLRMDELARASALLGEMEGELRRRPPGFEFMATALLMQMIGHLSRAYSRMRGQASRPLLRLGEVLSHVEQHYAEPIRLGTLARIAHMSPSSLLRAFRGITGHAPIEYVIRLRVLRACDLLRAGGMKITEVAFRTGFRDSNYFARQFRRVIGATPREYARRARLGA